MILVICVENSGGMAYRGRRLSRDRLQRAHFRSFAGNTPVWVHPYTEKLYAADGGGEILRADENYLARCGAGEYALAERELPALPWDAVESIVLYRWNRDYPFDLAFPETALREFRLVKEECFAGSSHDEIRFEVYLR